MLLVFANASAASSAPDLPDLDIADATTGLAIPVAGIQGWDADYIQTQSLAYAPQSFEDEEIAVLGQTDEYWVRRLSKFLASLTFSAAGATAQVRAVFIDKNGHKSYSVAVTVPSSNIQEGGRYVADLLVFETYGANKMSLYVESVSSGDVNIQIAGV